MHHWGWFLRGIIVHLSCLCHPCLSFVSVTTRLHRGGVEPSAPQQKTSTSPSSHYAPPPPLPPPHATAAAQQLPRATARRRQLIFSSLVGGESKDRDIAPAVAPFEDTPFRPERASVSPIVINALVPLLFEEGADAGEAATAVLEQRNRSSDWRLTEEEERAVTDRICGVVENLTELRFMLATAVARTPSIAKYGMLSDYGMSENVEDDPLAQMNQAECLLALYMLHKEHGGVAAVDFLDADRLQVLEGQSRS